jgi:DNA-binding response OmpR family regulator
MEKKGLKGKILLVDDTPSTIGVVRTALEEEGYSVFVATSGEKGIKRAELTEPDLILLDIMMPGMNGRELAERLQSLRSEMKVIYMSGYTDEAIVHHGVLEPGLNFLQKPFAPERLACMVREVLDK